MKRESEAKQAGKFDTQQTELSDLTRLVKLLSGLDSNRFTISLGPLKFRISATFREFLLRGLSILLAYGAASAVHGLVGTLVLQVNLKERPAWIDVVDKSATVLLSASAILLTTGFLVHSLLNIYQSEAVYKEMKQLKSQVEKELQSENSA